MLALATLICLVPGWLFWDLLRFDRLHSDDFPYVAASRTLGRAWANLYVPHNTHIVPAWRVLTWAWVALAGRLANLQGALASASYAALVLVMVVTGAFVARETGQTALGLAAMVGVGTTWLMASAATWYSAGQTLWAGLGILLMLWFLQGWRRAGRTEAWRLVLAALMTWCAAGCWSIGHAAGPVGSVYLWADGRPRCRKTAWVPLGATLLTLAIGMALGGRQINATISFGGRTTLEATDPIQGVAHTLQAIPENLIFGNLGLLTDTTPAQGAVLTSALALAWFASVRRRGWHATPMECAGGALLLVSSLVEWSVRGYLPFPSLRGLVPWYDTIPHIGLVLFLAGWWAASRAPAPEPSKPAAPLTVGGALAVVLLQATLLVLHGPRVEEVFQGRVPAITPQERKAFPIPSLQHLRAVTIATERTLWQQRALARLDRAEAAARRLGIGRKAIREVFGRVEIPDLPIVYDAADMLDLPWEGRETDPTRVRQALQTWFTPEPDPMPPNTILERLGIPYDQDAPSAPQDDPNDKRRIRRLAPP